MRIRNTDFDLGHNTYVMAILNVTPDSFSDGGLHNSVDDAVDHALSMISEGADMIDIGGESTRPGHVKISAEEELSRVIPVIEGIRAKTDIPLSIDTTKAEVAKAALLAGADIINTVQGVDADPQLLKLAAATMAPAILTYEKNYVNQFGEALIAMAENAISAGVKEDKIILDPGIGFGKTQEENLRILNELPILTQTGFPLLLGCSRKSVIGYVNTGFGDPNESPPSERLPGTIVTTALAALGGVSIVRVHDVCENVQAVRMIKAVCTAGER